ncbi:hypothetical protein Nepgr_001813 [Nepenthes gracilis]|uniref:F-box domain-containing protein n=1 Tax=Nepenthes gracilis TaxID=150966 RepID=A0AAD3RXB7_NEPGR|nr:hypothetical protein Nepgr_001813 [Nepenthes gracilis]
MSEGCNSRRFSWLVKSCFPNPHDPQTIATIISHTTKIKTTISYLPDDLLLEILSRVSLSSLPSLYLVCRRWSHLLDSSAFLHVRRRHSVLHPTLFALSFSGDCLRASTLRLNLDTSWRNSVLLPNDTVHCDAGLHGLFSHPRLVAIGQKIYILGGNGTAEYDSWTGSVKLRSVMLSPRKKFAAAAVLGKIYVAGGASRTSAVEEYDPETDTWRVVSDSPRRRYGCVGVGVFGLFYVIGGLKIGASFEVARASAGTDAQTYVNSMDVYDVEAGVWLRSRTVPGGGCVVAACGAHGHVYVLASHAVELSFWRFNARRNCGSGRSSGGGSGFGEWFRMKSPPLLPQLRLDSTVRFGCVGVEDKVVLVQAGCIDELLRRSGWGVRGGCKGGGVVLIFDCVSEEWSRGADLPEVIQRAACVCVEC